MNGRDMGVNLSEMGAYPLAWAINTQVVGRRNRNVSCKRDNGVKVGQGRTGILARAISIAMTVRCNGNVTSRIENGVKLSEVGAYPMAWAIDK